MLMNEEQKKIMAILEQLSRYNEQLADCGAESVRDMEALTRSLQSRMSELQQLRFAPNGTQHVDAETLNAFSAKLRSLRNQVYECMAVVGGRLETARDRLRSTSRRGKAFRAYGAQSAGPRSRFQREYH